MGWLKGAIAGAVGVAGMAGAITTLRRALLSSDHQVKTHPEKVIERLYTAFGRSDELDVLTRRRLGDLIHFGYGAMWGAIYAIATEGRRPHPLVGGPSLAVALWILGFTTLMPTLGVQAGPWTWERREFVLTGTAHLAYGTVTALMLEALESLKQRN